MKLFILGLGLIVYFISSASCLGYFFGGSEEAPAAAANVSEESPASGASNQPEKDVESAEETSDLNIEDAFAKVQKVLKESGAGKFDFMNAFPVSLFVEATAFWPLVQKNEFVSLESTPVLVGISNQWDKNMTIFGISGDYSLVTTPDIILRNITVHRVQGQIASKEFATIRTDFKTELEQHFPEIRMRLFVDFTDENQKTWQRVIAFNETVCIVMKEEGNAFFDAEALLLYGVLLGASFLVYYFFYKPADQQTHGGRVASPSASGLLSTKSATPTESTSSLPSNNPNEWIPASHLKQQAKGKRVY